MRHYCLKNVSLSYFNRPFIAQSDKDAIAMVRNAILSEGEDSRLLKTIFDAELYFIAEFDPLSGRFKGKREKIIDVRDIPFPKNKEEK